MRYVEQRQKEVSRMHVHEPAAVLCDLLAQMGTSIPARLVALTFKSISPINVEETQLVISAPSQNFKPLRLIVMQGSEYAMGFEIADVLISGHSQLVCKTPFIWREGWWPMDPCPKDHDIALKVTNISATPSYFWAAMLGEASE